MEIVKVIQREIFFQILCGLDQKGAVVQIHETVRVIIEEIRINI